MNPFHDPGWACPNCKGMGGGQHSAGCSLWGQDMSDDKPGFSLDRIMTMCPACGDGQRFFLMRSEVGKLVKAARAKLDAEPYASGTPYDPRAEAATRALEAALKPFEGP